MKATLSLAAILLAAGIPAANAQTELAIAKHTSHCPSCSMKDQKILKLQAELAAMKNETPRTSELQAEAVPITPEPAQDFPAPKASGNTYTVVPGDGLMKIARKTQCRAADIAAVNNMAMNDIIRPGQVLKLPSSATVAAVPPKASVIEEAPKPAQPKTYKIKEGETYYSISRRLKVPLDELMAANPKAPANRLYTGRVINLPVKGDVAAPAPVPTPEETTPETAAAPAPEADTTPETTTEEPPAIAEATPPAEPEKKIIAVSVDEEISYGDFASKYGTDTDRLNSLNDLTLTSATILAKGSELYVPAKP